MPTHQSIASRIRVSGVADWMAVIAAVAILLLPTTALIITGSTSGLSEGAQTVLNVVAGVFLLVWTMRLNGLDSPVWLLPGIRIFANRVARKVVVTLLIVFSLVLVCLEITVSRL